MAKQLLEATQWPLLLQQTQSQKSFINNFQTVS